MFAQDRDLLILEPALFRDGIILGQRLFAGLGSIASTTLTLSGVDLALMGVTAGHVAVVDGAGLEVTARLSATTLALSRPRALLGDAPVPPTAGSNKITHISTFLPQIALAHAQILALLGLEPAGSTRRDALLETQVTNPRALALVEAYAALQHIYAGAAAREPQGGPLDARAKFYADRFSAERSRAAALVDLDGDGQPDGVQALAVISLIRA
ncbi:MAG: hypothetical protein ACT4PL_11245 [Phycisphaerales bacterium]